MRCFSYLFQATTKSFFPTNHVKCIQQHKSVSNALAIFSVQILTHIDGHTNLADVVRVLKQLCHCVSTVTPHLGPLGCLFATLPPESHPQCTNGSLNLPGLTLPTPLYIHSMHAATGDLECSTWIAHKMKKQQHQTEELGPPWPLLTYPWHHVQQIC